MGILSSELIYRQSRSVSELAGNGGRMSHLQWTNGGPGRPWLSAGTLERANGSVKYRKGGWHVASEDAEPCENLAVFLDRVTPGDDRLVFSRGSHDDIQSDVTGGSPVWFGAANLNATVSLGATEIAVILEDPAVSLFRDGMMIRISNMANAMAETGDEEFILISGTPSLAGSVLTITLATALENGYSNTNTTVSGLLMSTLVACSVEDVTLTSVAGTFDDAAVTFNRIGAAYEVLTLTFTSATAFTCSGDTFGSLGAGSIIGTFQPSHPQLARPLIIIPPSAWGGTFANGDTLELTVVPAAVPIWERRTIPAGCGALSANSRRLVAVRL